MDNTVLIVAIVAGVVLVVLWLFRPVLSRFFLKANREGVEASLETREQTAASTIQNEERASINVSGNRQIGRDHRIGVGRKDVNVSDNLQLGDKQTIDVKPNKNK